MSHPGLVTIETDDVLAKTGMNSSQHFVALGSVIGVFGVKGWIKVHSDTSPRENIVKFREWHLMPAQATTEANWNKVVVVDGRTQGKNIIAKLSGIDTPEQAAELRSQVIYVPRQDLPALVEGEFYWTDIIGFDVHDTQGALLGSVARLFETGANDVMVVRPERQDDSSDVANDRNQGHSETEILIPWVRDSVIVKVDLAAKNIQVDWDPDY